MMLAKLQTLAWPGLYPRRESRPLWVAISLALIAAIAGADYITGYEFSLYVVYLIPISLATWTIGRAAGAVTACLAVALWVLTFATDNPFSRPFFFAWEALLQLCIYFVFVVVLDRLKIALVRADERFVTVLEGLDALVYVLRPIDGALLYVNRKAREAFGGGAPPDAREIERRFDIRIGDFSAPARDRATMPIEVRDSATGIWYWLSEREIRWVDGKIVQLHIATDISTRKRAEQIARQQHDKLEVTARLITAGEMATLLAHELNQPLAAIANYNMGCVRRLRSGNWQPEELLAALEKSSLQAERAGGILQRVREFLRKREPDLGACDLNEMIREVAGTVQADVGRHAIDVGLDLESRLPRALADGIMIRQVLLNLLRNGVESMQDMPAEQRQLRVRSSAQPTGGLHVEIADRGCGLPVELAENPFRPFFTTKAEGMGMGLQICRSIIEFHGGRIWATANAGGGTTFHFTLAIAKP